MENQRFNPLYVLSAALGILLLLIATVFFLLKGGSKETQTDGTKKTNPSPTLIGIAPENQPTIEATSTGALLGDIPQELVDLTTQKKELRDKVPLKEDKFTIAFDFIADKFVVLLKDPKTETRSIFETWLQNNYPAIPLDRFTFK